MKHVTVTICTGTTCFVMGAGPLQDVAERLPEDVRPFVDIAASHCLGLCKDRNFGRAPFVKIDDQVLPSVTLDQLVETVVAAVRDDA